MIGLRTIEVVAPSEAGTLLFESMNGREAMGTLFEFHVDLRSTNGDVPIASLLGKPFSIELNKGMGAPRWWNGMIASFGLEEWTGDHFQYRAVLRPLMWLLTRTSNSQIFQNQTHPRRHHGHVQGAGDSGQEAAGTGELRVVGVPGSVQRDRLQLRQPPDGAGRHLLLLRRMRRGSTPVVLVDALTVHGRVPGYSKIPVRRDRRTVRST